MEEVSVWAFPFLNSLPIHHFVIPAAGETTVRSIPSEKST